MKEAIDYFSKFLTEFSSAHIFNGLFVANRFEIYFKNKSLIVLNIHVDWRSAVSDRFHVHKMEIREFMK